MSINSLQTSLTGETYPPRILSYLSPMEQACLTSVSTRVHSAVTAYNRNRHERYAGQEANFSTSLRQRKFSDYSYQLLMEKESGPSEKRFANPEEAYARLKSNFKTYYQEMTEPNTVVFDDQNVRVFVYENPERFKKLAKRNGIVPYDSSYWQRRHAPCNCHFFGESVFMGPHYVHFLSERTLLMRRRTILSEGELEKTAFSLSQFYGRDKIPHSPSEVSDYSFFQTFKDSPALIKRQASISKLAAYYYETQADKELSSSNAKNIQAFVSAHTNWVMPWVDQWSSLIEWNNFSLALAEMFIHLSVTDLSAILERSEGYTDPEEDELISSLCDKYAYSIFAHGCERGKGGLLSLINILLEGELRKGCYGSLGHISNPMRSSEAAPHGPFYVILDPKQSSQPRGGGTIPLRFLNPDYVKPRNVAFLVPLKLDKELVLKALNAALEARIVTPEEAEDLEKRVFTITEFCNLDETRFDQLHEAPTEQALLKQFAKRFGLEILPFERLLADFDRLLSSSTKRGVYEELYKIQRKDFWRSGEYSFRREEGHDASPAERSQALLNYLARIS